MAVSKELDTYPQSYLVALGELLDFVAVENPHFGQRELRVIAKDFRNAEQVLISDIELLPLTAGSFKHNKLFRYAPFYRNYFIKYIPIPPNAETNPDVTHVLLERVIRQNSGTYNGNFMNSVSDIDLY